MALVDSTKLASVQGIVEQMLMRKDCGYWAYIHGHPHRIREALTEILRLLDADDILERMRDETKDYTKAY